MHLRAKVARLARWHPDRPAIVDDRGACSFGHFHARITRLGNALHGIGLERGDRVALLIPDSREYLEADYGVMAAGFVRVPIHPRLTRRELIELLRHAGARALITHQSYAAKINGLADEVESLDHVINIGHGADIAYETLLEKSSEQPLPE